MTLIEKLTDLMGRTVSNSDAALINVARDRLSTLEGENERRGKALTDARRLPLIVEEMIELEMLGREGDREALERYRQDRIRILQQIDQALSDPQS
jgi:hypothetical protein